MEKTQQREYLKIVVVAVIVGVLAFGAGMKWQQKKSGAFMANAGFGAGNFPGRAGGPGGMMTGGQRTGSARGGFRPVTGQIISSDDKSITVKLQDGSSKIVFVGDSTSINKADKADKSALVTGEQVAVFGSDNSDGSVTASSIQLNPAQLGMMRTGATPSASPKPAAY